MKKFLLIMLIVIIAIGVGAGGYFIYKTTTPEYALYRMMQEVNASGIDALMPHLTGEAREKVEKVGDYTEKSGLASLIGSALKDKAIEFIKSKADEIEWSLGDVRRGSKSADVDIGFDYKGNVTGTIEIKLIKENGKWKISGIGMPGFTKMKLF